jgi:hypothetical protein
MLFDGTLAVFSPLSCITYADPVGLCQFATCGIAANSGANGRIAASTTKSGATRDGRAYYPGAFAHPSSSNCQFNQPANRFGHG